MEVELSCLSTFLQNSSQKAYHVCEPELSLKWLSAFTSKYLDDMTEQNCKLDQTAPEGVGCSGLIHFAIPSVLFHTLSVK